MPVNLDALEEELSSTPTIDPDKPAETKVDRGDDFVPEKPAAKAEAPKEEPEEEPKAEEPKEEPKEEAKAAEEPKEEPKEEPARDDKGRFITVPKARFDEAVKKERSRAEAAERALAEALASAKGKDSKDVEAVEAEIDELTANYHQLLSDGKLDEARPMLKKIRQLDRELVRMQVLPMAQETSAAQTRAQSLEAVVDLYKAEFPVFDDASEAFDQEVVNWVARQQGIYQNAGYAPAIALQEAADLAILKFNLKPAGAKEDAPKKPSKADKDAERTQAGVKKALGVKQPAPLSDVGTDSDKAGLTKINPLELSYEDFEKLGDSEKKRLRGDIV